MDELTSNREYRTHGHNNGRIPTTPGSGVNHRFLGQLNRRPQLERQDIVNQPTFGIDPGQKNQITMIQGPTLQDIRSWNNIPAVPPPLNPRRRLREQDNLFTLPPIYSNDVNLP
jgi:hypothetical protein